MQDQVTFRELLSMTTILSEIYNLYFDKLESVEL